MVKKQRKNKHKRKELIEKDRYNAILKLFIKISKE